MSALSARYNGFMLGHFLAAGAFRSLRPRYPLLRRRVNAFLAEVDVAVRLPFRATDYQRDPFRQMLDVLEALRRTSVDGATAAWLSAATILRARGVSGFRSADLVAAARGLGVEPAQLRQYSRDVPRTRRVSVAELLNPAMLFLHSLLAGMRVERRTCFVAMPFRKDFERRYTTFYLPALTQLGYRAIRAWGGVGMEDYLEVILALMSRAGACLADVSGRNPNVLYELGAAQGMGKKVIVLSAESSREPPANVSQHTAFRFHYDPHAPEWPQGEVTRFVAQTSFAEFAQTATPVG